MKSLEHRGGTCIVCFEMPEPQTRVAFRGSEKWLVTALETLIGDLAAARTIVRQNRKHIRQTTNPDAPTMGTGGKGLGTKWYEMAVTLCPECAAKHNLDLGTKAGGTIPCYDEKWTWRE